MRKDQHATCHCRTFQRDICSPHISDLVNRLAHIRITPSTQMESESPIRLPCRQPDQLAVLFDHLLRRRSREEVKVKYAAYHSIFDQGDIGRRRREEKDVRASRAEQEDTMRLRAFRCAVVAVLQVYRMGAIAVRLRRHIDEQYGELTEHTCFDQSGRHRLSPITSG